jgi:hypothetical protein
MKKSEAFDSSLKKTFNECCEGEELKKEWSDEFDEKYYNKNNPSGLNTRGFKFQKQMIDDVKSFISSLLAKQQEEFVKILESKKNGEKCPKGWGCDHCGGCVDLYDEALDDVLADIKSKLNI